MLVMPSKNSPFPRLAQPQKMTDWIWPQRQRDTWYRVEEGKGMYIWHLNRGRRGVSQFLTKGREVALIWHWQDERRGSKIPKFLSRRLMYTAPEGRGCGHLTPMRVYYLDWRGFRYYYYCGAGECNCLLPTSHSLHLALPAQRIWQE